MACPPMKINTYFVCHAPPPPLPPTSLAFSPIASHLPLQVFFYVQQDCILVKFLHVSYMFNIKTVYGVIPYQLIQNS